jgi:hypothetical protein
VSAHTLYELTPSQELSMLNRHWTLHKSIVNIATSVTFDAPLERHLLAEAIRLCVLRWDAFAIRIVKEGKTFRQYFGDRDCLYVEQREFSDPAAMKRFFARRAAARIPLVGSPQAGFVVFTAPDGRTGIYSVICHLIMDSWAIARFYRDVIDVYWALSNREPLPAPPYDHEPILLKELEYHHSARTQSDRTFWEQEIGVSQPLFTSLKGSGVLARYRRMIRNPRARQCWVQHLRTKADHVVLTVSPEDVARFQAFLNEAKLPSMQALFALALRLYLAKVNDRTEDVTMGVNVARRATVAEKNSGGSRVQNLTLRTVMPESMTFIEALELLMDKQNQLFRHADFSSMEMLFLPHRLYADLGSRPGTGYCDALMTFQPTPMAVGHGLHCSTDWHCNGAFSMLSYLTVMDDDASGGLRCYWERQVHHLPVSTIRACHSFMVAVMRAGTERPSITVGELMDLS